MHHIDLAIIHLDQGATADEGEDHGCVMEWVARFAGLPVTDHPKCTSPVLTAFAIAWNDALPDETRQRLRAFIPRLVDTAGDPEADQRRAWLATDWLVRTFTVTWLRKAGLTARADELAALPALTSTALAKAAQPIIEAAKKEAYAAGAAAGDAAWAAAWDAAGDAAWDAAGDAAGAAAWDAAGDAAGDAAWAAAGDAAGDAARAAAGDAAGDAARAAYEKTKGSGTVKYNAAYRAARPILDEAFRETTTELTESAFRLFSDMIDVRSAVPA